MYKLKSFLFIFYSGYKRCNGKTGTSVMIKYVFYLFWLLWLICWRAMLTRGLISHSAKEGSSQLVDYGISSEISGSSNPMALERGVVWLEFGSFQAHGICNRYFGFFWFMSPQDMLYV